MEQGKLANIGVSNFGIGHLEKLLKTAKVVPAVNQIELTPFLQRRELVDYCKSKGIALEVLTMPHGTC
jgi:diketogulonate reductase-like aldo/keto reductase